MTDSESGDVAVVVYREDATWEADLLPPALTEDLDQVLPAGDLSIFTDLGLDEMDLGMIAGNLDLFPDEALAIIARKLGLGQAYERSLALALGRVP